MTPQEISVVVQGPVVRDTGPDNNTNPTSVVLASVRRVLPGAELILSTWQGTDVAGLDYDRLILNDDPGPWEWMGPKGMNVNRQIVSTRNGLAMASRPYAMKLRTDTLLENDGFVRRFIADTVSRSDQWRVFSRRVVVSAAGTFDPRIWPVLFYVSDLFFFGLRDDLRSLFDLPIGPVDWLTEPVPPDVFIWMSALRKAGQPIRPFGKWGFRVHPGRLGGGIREVLQSERLLVNNLIVCDPCDLGVLFPRRFYPGMYFAYPPHRIARLERTLLGRPSSLSRIRHLFEAIYLAYWKSPLVWWSIRRSTA